MIHTITAISTRTIFKTVPPVLSVTRFFLFVFIWISTILQRDWLSLIHSDWETTRSLHRNARLTVLLVQGVMVLRWTVICVYCGGAAHYDTCKFNLETPLCTIWHLFYGNVSGLSLLYFRRFMFFNKWIFLALHYFHVLAHLKVLCNWLWMFICNYLYLLRIVCTDYF